MAKLEKSTEFSQTWKNLAKFSPYLFDERHGRRQENADIPPRLFNSLGELLDEQNCYESLSTPCFQVHYNILFLGFLA
jgi:hypothetical protein